MMRGRSFEIWLVDSINNRRVIDIYMDSVFLLLLILGRG